MIEIEDGGHGGPHHGQAPQAYSNNGMVPGKALLLFLRVPRSLLSAARLLAVIRGFRSGFSLDLSSGLIGSLTSLR